MKNTLFILLSTLAGGAGQLLLRAGARGSGARLAGDAFSLAAWLAVLGDMRVIAGLSAWIFSTLVWLFVLSRSELGYAYGLGAANYVVVPLLASWTMGEDLPALRVVGMLVITVGIALVLASRTPGIDGPP